MAFKLAQKPTFTARVKVETPNQKGGFDRSEFQVVFKRVNMDEVEEYRSMKAVDVLTKTITGWHDLIDDDNKEVDFNDDNLSALLQIPQALTALSESFWTCQFKAKEKN